MEKIIEFETEHDGIILIKGEVKPAEGMSNIGSSDENAKGGRISEALHSVKAFANAFWKSIEHIDVKPDEVEVKTGLTFKGESGKVVACFVNISGEATFEVTMKWKLAKETALNPS